jgi:LacI family transcriptional regulator
MTRPTLKTIAEQTGLAVTTISRALADDPKIAQKTRTKVALAAKAIGYVPDRAAQHLRTGKTKVISLILDPHQEMLNFGNSLIIGLTQGLKESGYHLNITPHFAGGDLNSPVEYIVRNKLADGILFSRTEPFDERVRFLQEQNIPFVTHGQTEFSQPHAFVDYDNEAFSAQATETLHRLGAKNITIILPPKNFTFYQHLRYGFIKTARALGIEVFITEQINLDSSRDEIKAWAIEQAQKENRPDGFICPGEASYLAIMDAYRSMGLTHGNDYHAVVKASSDLLEQIDPSVELIHEDIILTGEKMAEYLLAAMAGSAVDSLQWLQRIKS